LIHFYKSVSHCTACLTPSYTNYIYYNFYTYYTN